ncbi:MAG: hypothetical protein ACE5KH_00410 [Candidatus Geothermarchaeales archaeon]
MKSQAGAVAAVVVAALVYVQLILGGGVLITRAVPGWASEVWRDAHVGLGNIIWLLAIIPAVILWRLKPPSRTLRIGGITLFVLTFIQAGIGFAGPWGSVAVMAAHGLTAALIFAAAVALAVLAVWE